MGELQGRFLHEEQQQLQQKIDDDGNGNTDGQLSAVAEEEDSKDVSNANMLQQQPSHPSHTSTSMSSGSWKKKQQGLCPHGEHSQ